MSVVISLIHLQPDKFGQGRIDWEVDSSTYGLTGSVLKLFERLTESTVDGFVELFTLPATVVRASAIDADKRFLFTRADSASFPVVVLNRTLMFTNRHIEY